MTSYQEVSFEVQYDSEPLDKASYCLICMSRIDVNYARITVTEPVIQTIYYDIPCLQGLIAVTLEHEEAIGLT